MKPEVIVIAEAGVNHNGSIGVAKELIVHAAEAGADYVKFQTFKADSLVSKLAPKAQYQSKNTEGEDRQYEMLKSLELSETDHKEILKQCDRSGIKFLSTAFDLEGLDYLHGLGMDFFKIPSGEITNLPYLRRVARFKQPVVLSTGMATLEEIEQAILVLEEEGLSKASLTVLHCTTEYPAPMQDINLKAMLTIGEKCGVNIGYSDHTMGIEVPIAAVALGAKVIEKHFTLDRELPGPDHKASLLPDELNQMIRAIRNIEMAISGDGIKQPSQSEKANLSVARKSIHIARELDKGNIIKEEDLIMLRPGDGISPMDLPKVLGRHVNRKMDLGDKLAYQDLV